MQSLLTTAATPQGHPGGTESPPEIEPGRVHGRHSGTMRTTRSLPYTNLSMVITHAHAKPNWSSTEMDTALPMGANHVISIPDNMWKVLYIWVGVDGHLVTKAGLQVRLGDNFRYPPSMETPQDPVDPDRPQHSFGASIPSHLQAATNTTPPPTEPGRSPP